VRDRHQPGASAKHARRGLEGGRAHLRARDRDGRDLPGHGVPVGLSRRGADRVVPPRLCALSADSRAGWAARAPHADAEGRVTTAPAPTDNAFLLAVERTRLAHERTLIAWVRTALSMISFGFTVYKFFQLELEKLQSHPPERLLSPRV